MRKIDPAEPSNILKKDFDRSGGQFVAHSSAKAYNVFVVDESLLLDERPLRYLFLDLNAYFASVEQQEHPELRGLPVAVVPLMADSTCVIAASYEAKKHGVKTGVLVREAKERCPDLVLLQATPKLYTRYHNRVLEAVDSVLPVDKVCSIDEMQFQLIGLERTEATARDLGIRLKKAIAEQVGECMTCSVGIAPNAFLAKLATDMQKPDGLVVLHFRDLPTKLLELGLTEFTGINRRMKARLNGAGVFSVSDLYALDQRGLRAAFGSKTGEAWWYKLRGYDWQDDRNERKSLSHSYVLPPELRNDAGCRQVLMRLLEKASARLRANHLCAGSVAFSVSGFETTWRQELKLSGTSDTVLLNELLREAWKTRDFAKPRSVGVVFSQLGPATAATPSLFDATHERDRLNAAVDKVNQRFGKHSIFVASIESALE